MPDKKDQTSPRRKKAPPPKEKSSPSEKEEKKLTPKLSEPLKPTKKKKAGQVTLEINAKPAEKPATTHKNNTWIRHSAELVYVTDRTGLTIHEISEMPQFKGMVTVRQLDNWRTKYGWIEKRKEYFSGLSEELKKKIANVQLQSTLNILETLDTVYEEGYKKLISGEVKAATWEGTLNAQIKLAKTLKELRQEVLGEMLPATDGIGGSKEQEATISAPELSDAEARAGAMAIIRLRMEEQERKAKEAAAAAAGEGEGFTEVDEDVSQIEDGDG